MSENTARERDTEACPSGSRPPRPGVRVAQAGHEPTGMFAVVEMTVLVVVTALAMVSVIVSSGGDDAVGHRRAASAAVRHAAFGDDVVRRADRADPHGDRSR